MIKLNPTCNLEYAFSGIFKSDGTWQHPRVTIDTYEIIFMYEGTAYICEDGIEYTLNKNDILVLDPGKEHYGFRPSDKFVSFSWLHYRTNCEEYKNLPKHFTATNPSALKTLFSQCDHTANTPGYNPICVDLYTVLYIEEILYSSKTGAIPQNYLAAQVKDYISLNTEKDLTVSYVAQKFGYHENYISKIFKETYGIPLKKYITSKKLENACTLLNTSLYTVKQIACLLSFKSENHFIKFFKYHKRITPSEYRNSYTNIRTNKS